MHFRAAGTVGAIVTCPLEVVKTRQQSSRGSLMTSLAGSEAPPQSRNLKMPPSVNGE